MGAGFLRVLQFPLPIIPPISPSSQSPWAGKIGLSVATVLSGPNWTPPPTIPTKIFIMREDEVISSHPQVSSSKQYMEFYQNLLHSGLTLKVIK
jgi:hypothetical protein